jgi:hypothetical protein
MRLKCSFLSLLGLLAVSESFGQVTQPDKQPNHPNEISLSFNRTMLYDNNTVNKSGLGFGFQHIDQITNRFSFTLGIEFINTNQVKKEMFDIVTQKNYLIAYSKNVTYNIYSFSFPYTWRYNLGKQNRFFVEGGLFIDVNGSRRHGTMYTWSNDNDPDGEWVGYQFEDKGWLSVMNCGPLAGLGFHYQFDKTDLLIKAHYKHGVYELYTLRNKVENSYLQFSIGIRTKKFWE